MLTLIALNGQEKGREFQLTGEEPMLIGRQASALPLTDSQTSRRHAEILLENSTWLIRDLGSTNGTWVNGQKIAQITELEPGDRIVLGRHQFRVGKITDASAPSPQPKPHTPEPVIGSEELAEMGVDLGESLSADILEDDDLPALPDGSIEQDTSIETHAPGGTQMPAESIPAEQPEVPPSVSGGPGGSGVDDDILDLDALLGDDLPGADSGPDVPDQAGPPDSSEPTETPPPPVPPPTEDKAPKPQLSEPPASVPTETPKESPAKESLGQPGADGVIDLDALLEEVSEPAAPPVPSTTLDIEPETSGTDQAVTDEPKAPPEEEAETDEPLTPDAPESPQAPPAPVPTVSSELSEPPPLSEAAQAPDTPQAPEESQEQDTQSPEPTGEVESDELIDFDILASAEPTTTFQAPEEKPGQEADVSADPPDEPTTPQTTPPEISPDVVPPAAAPAPSDPPGEELIDDMGDELVELDEREASSADSADLSGLSDAPVTTDDLADADPVEEQADAVEDDELVPAEKALLMTPDEQTEALAGYKRSRVKTLLVLVLVLVGVGVVAYLIFSPSETSSPNSDRANASTVSESPQDADNPPPLTVPLLPTDEDRDDPESVADDAQVFSPPVSPSLPQAPKGELLTPQKTPEASPPTDGTSDTGDGADQPQTASPQSASTPEPPDWQPDTHRELGKPLDVTESTGRSQMPSPMPMPVSRGTASQTGPDPELKLLADAVDAQHRKDPTDQTAFAGAQRVAFIVDASGSLVDSFPYVLSELGGAMSELPDDSAFTIIFFGSEGVVEVPPIGLRWANQQTKRQVRRWIAPTSGNISAWGRGDPFEALEKALTYQVDEIFIFSDNLLGQRLTPEEAQASVDRVVDLLDGKVQRVNVIQFFDRDPYQVLKQIAQAFEGRHVQIEPQAAAQAPGTDPLSTP